VTFKIGVDLNTAQVLVQNRVSSALSQLPQAVLAGQYESWYAPISVILAVPLSFIGPVVALSALTESGLNNNLYVQIGLVLLMALSAKNAILIVEFAREVRAAGKPILDSASEAARARFRPIIMTSLPSSSVWCRSCSRAAPAPARACRSASPCLAECSPQPAWRFCSCRRSSWWCSVSRSGAKHARLRRRRASRRSSCLPAQRPR